MRKLLSVLAVGLVGLCAPSGTAAAAQLDPSFGQSGVVHVTPPLSPPWTSQTVQQLAGARDGSSFALVARRSCTGSPCVGSHDLFRYLPDGTLDPSFAGGSFPLPEQPETFVSLAVDSLGRPLLAVALKGRMVVRRLTPEGTPDPTFGEGGVLTLPCPCSGWGSRLIPGPDGTFTVAAHGEEREGYGYKQLLLIRVLDDGAVDANFGVDGTAVVLLPSGDSLVATVSSPRGVLYLGGFRCCGAQATYFVRVSAKGRLDTRFAERARRSFAAASKAGKSYFELNAVVVRPGGKVDLLGDAGYRTGFSLRLNPDGSLHRGYARNGFRRLSRPVSAAALGSDGATLAVSGSEGGPAIARILAGGQVDPMFRWRGIPEARRDFGFSVVPQVGRKALVLDLGLRECRGYCSVAPKLVRFLEGHRQRRR